MRLASPKEIDTHFPKLAYALSAVALAILLAHVSSAQFFSEHPLTSAALGATMPLGLISGAAINLCGWEKLSRAQKTLVLLTLVFGAFTLAQAMWTISHLVGLGTTVGVGVAAALLWLGGPRRV